MPDKKKKYAVYVREARSPDGVGVSLNAQVDDCMELALSLGYSEDEAIVLHEIGSGTTLDRPVLNELRALTAAGKLEAVIVESPHRLSRVMLDLATLFDEFNRHGVEVHFVHGSGFIPDQVELARVGFMPVGGAQPEGYDYDPVSRNRVVNEAEVVVVQRIFQAFYDGASMLKIAKMLNDEGVRSKMGGLWTAMAIRRILTNSSYIGVDHYGKRRRLFDARGVSERVSAPRDEWTEIRGYSPAVISEKLFDAVKKRLNRKS